MAVVGAFTGGNDGGSAAASTTVQNLTISGAGTPNVGDIPVVVLNLANGSNRLSTSTPTLTAQSGPDVTGAGVYYLLDEAAGLTSGDITADTLAETITISARSMAAGVLVRGQTLTGALVPTATLGTSGTSIAIPSQASVPAGS